MTDQEIDEIATPFSSFCVASGSREFDHLGFARALFSKSAQSIMNNAAIDDIAAEVFGTMATHQERQFANRILSRAIPEGHVVVPGWLPIESAPKGSGIGKLTTDPDYVAPPAILLLFDEGKIAIGYWDWYYAEGGRGYEGGLAWIAQEAGERLDLHYDAPIGWMPLPAAPANKEG